MKKLILILAAVIACTTAWCQPQPDYIPDQLGRDAHHIIQSLGAFVGNERSLTSPTCPRATTWEA